MNKLFGKNNLLSVSFDLLTLPTEIEETTKVINEYKSKIDTNDKYIKHLVEANELIKDKIKEIDDQLSLFNSQLMRDFNKMSPDEFKNISTEIFNLKVAKNELNEKEENNKTEIERNQIILGDMVRLYDDKNDHLTKLEDKLKRKKAQMKAH